MNKDSKNIVENEDSPPPFFKNWSTAYGIVFLNLVVLVLLFYLFTKAFE
jgi:hypothetical protein